MTPGFLHAELLRRAPFIEADRQLARELAGRSDDGASDIAPFAAAWLLCRVRQGASRVDLASAPEWPADWPERPAWPSREGWETLAAAGGRLVGGPDDYRPLVVENGGLHLHRFRRMENALAQKLRTLAAAPVAAPGDATRALLDTLFARNARLTRDLQKEAVAGALRRRFAVITGGPGTGKTTCVLNLLLALLSENPALGIALAAPTGKAAARLNESLAQGVARLEKAPPAGLDIALLKKIPADARTLHSRLGITQDTPEGNPNVAGHIASADVVVVDEASMIPLPLMTVLAGSLRDDARLILLGDRDQLASVEVGSVLGDIVRVGEGVPPARSLEGVVHRLAHSYRFREDEVVGAFCLALQNDGPAEAIAALKKFGSLAPAPGATGPESPESIVAGYARSHFQKLAEPGLAPAEALKRLDEFRILCSHRGGPVGVAEVNRLAHRALGRRPGDLFPGLPVLITVNTREYDLRNGDCGVILRDAGSDALRAWFPGTDAAARPRAFLPSRLPDWEPAFAMTIHKAQGSEFDAVAMLLPAEDSPLLTRELVYTGASRAKSRLVVHAGEATLASALSKSVARPSGLAARLA